MAHQVLARQYRPKNFSQVIGQSHVVRALTNALTQQYLHHAYLFTGTRGVGKTTIARILAKCLNCEAGISATPCGKCDTCLEIDSGRFPDLYEVDAASRTKVEDTRELLDNVQYTPTKGRYKIYLIDEVHMLSGHSFNALLKTLEEPPEHVKFLLATTDPQKLPATVLSRCLQFHLLLMSQEETSHHLADILSKEKISFEQTALPPLAKAANGSMRDALSLLDQAIAFGNGSVNTADVKNMLGTIELTALYDILSALEKQDANLLLASAQKLSEQGADFHAALAELLSLFHQIAMHQLAPDANQLEDQLHPFANSISKEDIQLYYQIGLIGQRDLNYAPTPRSGFEMTLLRMHSFVPQSALTATQPKVATPPPQSQAKSSPTLQPACAQQTNNQSVKRITELKTTQDWQNLIPSLQLTGAAIALVQHCNLKQVTENEIHFLLERKHEPLCQPKYIDRLNKALRHYFNQSIHVMIAFHDQTDELDTPVSLAKQQHSDRMEKAKSNIMNDQKVQQLMDAFDATIVNDSINFKED